MAKKNKLKTFENKIFYGEYTDEEWRKLDEELQEEYEKASEEERKAFIDSGAGNMMAMIMEYME